MVFSNYHRKTSLISASQDMTTNNKLFGVVFTPHDEEASLEAVCDATSDVLHREFAVDHLRTIQYQTK
jgi:phosphoserine aminotransferase